ncbi:MAG TPA: LPS assembly lipoprotein LptE [Candidatus Paceibacterota bacterium]|nr:LPS assembly lipoprotein LptE [Candidatus Paceibacterota bacterium]
MRFLRLALVGLAAIALGGCAGYRLGPTNGMEAGAKSLQLTPFSNQTMQPRLGDAVTTALRRNLQRDGTFQLSTHGDANIEVTGVLTRYDRHELSFVPRDVLTISDFRINVTAHVTARDRTSGKTLLDRDVTGYTLVRVGADLTSAERQALPVLADDLAKNITALLVDGSW